MGPEQYHSETQRSAKSVDEPIKSLKPLMLPLKVEEYAKIVESRSTKHEREEETTGFGGRLRRNSTSDRILNEGAGNKALS